MKRKIRIWIGIAALLILAGLALYGLCSGQCDFSGSYVKNPDAYIMDIECMNARDAHAIALRAGSALRVHFETLAGSLRMEIVAPDGSILYAGNGTANPDFTIGIPADGTYEIRVAGRCARGCIRVQAE